MSGTATPGPTTPAELTAEAARLREELAATLELLSERVDPRVRAREAAEATRARVGRLAEQARARVERSTTAQRVAAAAVVALVGASAVAGVVAARQRH